MVMILDRVRRGLDSAFHGYAQRAAERWDHIYARGAAEMLDGAAIRARHYVIAGIVADLAGHAPRVLDVGCGFGITYRLLRRIEPVYEGIDPSTRAVQRCRARFAGDASSAFAAVDFARHEPRGRFDVIILNDVARCFPVHRAPAMIEKAVSLLAGPRGILVIALGSAIESPIVRAVCRVTLPHPLHRISVRAGPGSIFQGRWTVDVYTHLKEQQEVDEDWQGPPVSGVAGPAFRRRAS